MQGGSTITQQFVKNALVHNERTISRKLKEAALAWQLESGPRHWSKIKILTAYLNTIYLGNGAYGVETGVEGVLRARRKDVEPGGGRAARRDPGGSVALGSGQPPLAPREGAAAHRLLATLDQGHITHADFVRANREAAAQARGRGLPTSQNLRGAALDELRAGAAVERYGSSTVFRAVACACARRSTCVCSRMHATRSRSGRPGPVRRARRWSRWIRATVACCDGRR